MSKPKDQPFHAQSYVGRALQQDINKDLQALIEQLCSKLQEGYSNENEYKLELGEAASKVTKAPIKYGKKAIEQLASGVGIEKTVLYDYRKVIDVLKPSGARKLLEKRDKRRDLPLTMSHLAEFAAIDDSDVRNDLINQCLEVGLTVRQLKKVRRPSTGLETRNREMYTPIRRGRTYVESLLQEMKHWDETIFGNLIGSEGKITEQDHADLGLLKQKIDTLLGQASAYQNKIEDHLKPPKKPTKKKAATKNVAKNSTTAARKKKKQAA